MAAADEQRARLYCSNTAFGVDKALKFDKIVIMEDKLLCKNERIDDLQYKGLRLIQNPEYFCFGTDAVLLSGFVNLKNGDRVVDFGTGTGVIAILLAGQQKASEIIGIEIQKKVADMARRSVLLNRLEYVVRIVEGRIQEAKSLVGQATVVVCNPPYEKPETGKLNENSTHKYSRHEELCSFEEIVVSAAQILGTRGKFYVINRPERLAEMIYTLKSHRLEPKRIQFVYGAPGKDTKLVLMEALKEAKEGVKVLKPLYIYDEHHQYTKEVLKMYHME